MSIDIWNILSLVGTVAFASSGAIVAIEEEFDVLGLFILGFVTAFGGGAIRNVLIGLPIETLESRNCFLCSSSSYFVYYDFP